MGSRRADAKKILESIDGTIYQLQDRLGKLKYEAEHSEDEAAERAKKEMAWVSRQIGMMESAKKEIQVSMQKARTEEERRAINKLIGLVMMVGAVNENLRMKSEYLKREEKKTAAFDDLFNSVADAIFAEDIFRFTKREDVDDILKDEELQKMAKEDPNRLEREEEDFRAEYERMMSRTFAFYSLKLGDDFDQNEEQFRKFLKRQNGYEMVETITGAYVRDHFISPEGDEIRDEDRRFFTDVMAEVDDLKKITRELQTKYILGESSFEKGNGFTPELVEREKALLKKIRDFGEEKMKQAMDMDSGAKDYTTVMMMYEKSLMMYSPIERQMERDSVLQKNNELRRKMERWYVYRQLPKDDDTVLVESDEVRLHKGALAKLQRMEQMAAKRGMRADKELTPVELEQRKKALVEGKGDLTSNTSVWAVEKLQDLLGQLDDQENVEKDRLPLIRERLAALVIHQLISDDMRRKEGEPRFYFDEIKNHINQGTFETMSEELAESKTFRKIVDPMIKGEKVRENVCRFLACDFERGVAKRIYAERVKTAKNVKKTIKELTKAKKK